MIAVRESSRETIAGALVQVERLHLPQLPVKGRRL